jgi:hypothetical protein
MGDHIKGSGRGPGGSTNRIVMTGGALRSSARFALFAFAFAVALTPTWACNPTAVHLYLPVLTQHNDSRRSGVNLEQWLTTSNVKPGSFGKLFTRTLPASPNATVGHDRIYSQPLLVSNANPNRMIVATQFNMVYAFDAVNANARAPLWTANLGPPESANDDWPDPHCNLSLPVIGVLGTPVIGHNNNTGADALYVVSKNRSGALNSKTLSFTMHKLDVATGQELASIAVPSAAEAGFDPYHALQRAALVWVDNDKAPGGGFVYAAFGGHCDSSPFHGWIFGFDGNLQKQVTAFNSSPGSNGAGIWQAGQAPVYYGGSLYVSTGNGDASAKLANSVLKFNVGSNGQLTLVDSFTPHNQAALNKCDVDLSSAGPLLLDDLKYLVAGGKEGVFYVLDVTKLGQAVGQDSNPWQNGSLCEQNQGGGGFTPAYQWNPQGDSVFQAFVATKGHIHGSPVFAFNADKVERLYVWSEDDNLKAFSRGGGNKFSTTPSAQSNVPVAPGMPGGMLSISSAGGTGGDVIVWATHPKADAWSPPSPVGGVLYAFDAQDVSKNLWRSDQAASDNLGEYSKFTAPTIANGRVYVATFSDQIQVYGLLCNLNGTCQ